MIDLFLPPIVRVPPASVVHYIDEPVDKPFAARKRKGVSRRAEYYRKWHLANRERRLAEMKARYEADPQSYTRKAKKWAKENPEKAKAIKTANRKRRRLKKVLLRDPYMRTDHYEEEKTSW